MDCVPGFFLVPVISFAAGVLLPSCDSKDILDLYEFGEVMRIEMLQF